ncbi:MAG: hypothetical protein ACK48Y_01990, partial [Planctomyces sp.]
MALAFAVIVCGTCPWLIRGVAADLRMQVLQAKATTSLVPGQQPGRLNGTWSVDIELLIRVENDGETELSLQGSDVFMRSGDVLVRRRADGTEAAPRLDALAGGQSVDGTVKFQLLPWPADPGSLQLVLGVEGRPDDDNPVLDAEGRVVPGLSGEALAVVPLLKWVSECSRFSVDRLGPGGALALIRTQRDLDVLSAWALAGPFRDLLREDVERVVLTSAGAERRAVTDEVGVWLSGLQQNIRSNVRPGMLPPMMPPAVNIQPPFPVLDRSFRYLAVAEMNVSESGNPFARRRTTRGDLKLPESIAEGLAPVYRYAPIAEAIRDLQSEVAGVRLGALAGAVDRLTEDEAAAVLERARSGSVQQQLEVASWLNQIPGRRAVLALQEMSTG